MKKKLTIFLIIILGWVGVRAQQDAQFTLFPWALIYYNVGATGEQNNTLCFTGLFRQQYAGFKDVYTKDGKTVSDNTSPQQILLNMETYSRKLRGGIGLSLIKDKIGYYNNIGAKLGYAYKLRIPTGTLGIGLQVGFLNQQLDVAKLRPLQNGDPLILNLDQKKESWLDMDFNFGLFYKGTNWHAGLSGTQLIENIRVSGDKNILQMSRHFYIHGGYIWVIPQDPSWSLEPQTLIKTDFATAQWDLLVLARYNGILWMGASYRIQDAVSLVFGARPFYNSSNNYLKGIDMGLSYSFTTSKLGYSKNRSYGDFELMLRYCFDIFRTETFSGYGSTRTIYKNEY